MSGHSKWANIKRKKQANDQARGKIFSKLSRLITLAVSEGGGIGDPEHNVKLRLAVEKARQLNMPKENISRAVEKGAGPNKQALKEMIYEAFLPEGVSILIQATTDNVNRTLSEVKNTLERNGGKLGNQGSVSYQFERCGLITFKKNEANENQVFDFASRMDALDLDQDKDYYYVYIPFDHLGRVKDNLQGLRAESMEVDFKPKTKIPVSDKGKVDKLLMIIEALESLDDVHKVFGNFDFPEEYFANLK